MTTSIANDVMASPLRIFLVEDSPMLRERLVETLSTWDNAEIIGHAESQPWDVLILDLQLVHGTGLGVLRGLSGHRSPQSKVIVLTNYSIPSYRTHSMQLGADYFFDKVREFGCVFEVLNDIAKAKDSALPSGRDTPTKH